MTREMTPPTTLRPVAPLAQILGGALARRPRFQPSGAPRVERFTTVEGEYGLLAWTGGDLGGRRACVAVAVVYGDDDARVQEALGVGERCEDVASALRLEGQRVTVALGTRPRRYLHDAPRGWATRPSSGLATLYVAPEHAHSGAMIRVLPAEPALGAAAMLDAFVAGQRAAGVVLTALEAPRAIEGAELAGWSWRVLGHHPGGPPAAWELVILEDHRNIYPLWLECLATEIERALPVLEAVARSITPLPCVVGDGAATLFHSWVD